MNTSSPNHERYSFLAEFIEGENAPFPLQELTVAELGDFISGAEAFQGTIRQLALLRLGQSLEGSEFTLPTLFEGHPIHIYRTGADGTPVSIGLPIDYETAQSLRSSPAAQTDAWGTLLTIGSQRFIVSLPVMGRDTTIPDYTPGALSINVPENFLGPYLPRYLKAKEMIKHAQREIGEQCGQFLRRFCTDDYGQFAGLVGPVLGTYSHISSDPVWVWDTPVIKGEVAFVRFNAGTEGLLKNLKAEGFTIHEPQQKGAYSTVEIPLSMLGPQGPRGKIEPTESEAVQTMPTAEAVGKVVALPPRGSNFVDRAAA